MKVGKVLPAEITTEVQKAYLDYAMSVIVARALPDVRDGLKPVHRRILYAIQQMGLSPSSPYVKCAKIVGETMGKFHPHGDGPIYDALVRLAQDFSMRYPLIDPQGNFGSVDGDPPAAMRYTEARPSKISQELLLDIEKNTVEFEENFDATDLEPKYLPAVLPNLLLMGAEGIAVGMATKIPPHNLTEVIDSVCATIKKGRVVEIGVKKSKNCGNESFDIKKIDLLVARGGEAALDEINPTQVDFTSDITTEELLNFIKGPDFPTGGAIYGGRYLAEIYGAGRGKITVRGIAKIEEWRGDRSKIVISELPYQVNKALLVAKIAELARDKKINGISDLRDESDHRGMSVVVELKREAKPKAVLNNLYKHTQLQTSFPVNFVALVNGTPRTLPLKQILVEYVKHRQQIVTRRSIFELTEAKRRSHILEGLKIALDNLDEVIATIRKSKDSQIAKVRLMSKFGLTDIQATAILDMQLRRLSALEREKIEEEYKKLVEAIEYLVDLLTHPEKVLGVIEKEVSQLKEKYGDDRLTRVYANPVEELTDADLIAKEEVIITLTRTGYIKRVPRNIYRSQHRGGKGVSGMQTKETDEITHIVTASTHDQLMFFTDKGRVFSVRVWELPESSRQSKGQALVNLINVDQGESIQTILPFSFDGNGGDYKYLFMATRKGTVKKTAIGAFKNIKNKGLIAIRLDSGDLLAWVKPTDAKSHIILVSKKGKSIRFHEKDARPLGRPTRGVRGILLEEGDEVVGAEVFGEKQPVVKDKRKKAFRDILVITQRGLGKRTPVQYFPVQKRGGKGVKIANLNEKTGELTCAILVTQDAEQIAINSRLGQIIKLPVKNIPQLGRATQGVILMRFDKSKSDGVAAVTTLEKEIEEVEEETAVKV